MDFGDKEKLVVMDIQAVKFQIKSGTVLNYYIFSGDEWAIQRIYIEQIAKTKHATIQFLDSVSDVFQQSETGSLFQSTNCYVVREDKEFLGNEKLQNKIDDGALGENVLIFLLNSVDKRTKFYNRYKESIVVFEPLNAQILAKYVKREIPLSDKNCARLIEVCENNYGRCLLEIDKIKQFGGDVNEAFETLLRDGTIYRSAYDALFDFVDAVLSRKVNRSFTLYKYCVESNESVMVLLSVLYSNIKAVLQVQSCDSEDIGKTTGLSAWQIKNAKTYVDKYETWELVKTLKLIQKFESGIKNGIYNEQFTVEYLLSEVL